MNGIISAFRNSPGCVKSAQPSAGWAASNAGTPDYKVPVPGSQSPHDSEGIVDQLKSIWKKIVDSSHGGDGSLLYDRKNHRIVGAANDIDWKPWAYSAGSGALAYLLAKTMTDDDDDEKERKHESGWSRFIRNAMPYAVGAAGALGGYALSKSGQDNSLERIPGDGNGNPVVRNPESMPTGGLAKTLGWGAFGLGLGSTARAALMARYRNAMNAKNMIGAWGADEALENARGALDKAKKDFIAARNGKLSKELARVRTGTEKGLDGAESRFFTAQDALKASAKDHTAAKFRFDAAKAKVKGYDGARDLLMQLKPGGKGELTEAAIAARKAVQRNAAKIDTIPGTGIVRNAGKTVANTLGKNVPGKWGRFANMKGVGALGLASGAAALGLGALGAHQAGQRAEQEALVKAIREYGKTPVFQDK